MDQRLSGESQTQRIERLLGKEWLYLCLIHGGINHLIVIFGWSNGLLSAKCARVHESPLPFHFTGESFVNPLGDFLLADFGDFIFPGMMSNGDT